MTPKQLRKARDRLKLSQVAMAAKLGVSPRQYQNLEYGEIEINTLYDNAIIGMLQKYNK